MVLPAPLGPIRPDDLAGADASRSNRLTAMSPPKRLVSAVHLEQRHAARALPARAGAGSSP